MANIESKYMFYCTAEDAQAFKDFLDGKKFPSAEIRERPNSIETHRNAAGAWSVTVKVYFGNTQEDAEAANEWLNELNLRLLLTYAPADIIQSEVMAAKLERSLEAARERDTIKPAAGAMRERIIKELE